MSSHLAPKYAVDPTVKHHGFHISGALPPEGHARRCQSRSSKTRMQCRRWAAVGFDRCPFHRFRYRGNKAKEMGFYGRRTGMALAAALEELRKEGAPEVDIAEELEVARIIADRSISAFESCCLDPEQSKKASPELKAMATVQARDALTHVASLAEKLVKVRALSQAFVSATDIKMVADGTARIVEEVLRERGVDPSVSVEVAKRIREMPLPSKDQVRIVVS